jgi:L-malate glycosyltransferase
MNTIQSSPHVLFLVDMLHGLDSCGGVPSGLAGVEGVLLKVIRRIPPERYRFSVATFSLGQTQLSDIQFPCPLHLFPLKRTYDWNAFKMANGLRRLIRSEKVSIVHTFLESADIWGGLVAKLSGCPILVSGRRDMGYFRSKKHTFAYRIVNHLVDQVHAVSEEVRSFAIRNDGLDPQKVVTVHNGVALDATAENGSDHLRAVLDLDHCGPVIATVANIRPVKGIDILVQAAALVCREFPRVRFLIIGGVLDEPHFAQLRDLVRSLGLTDNVIFVGKSKDVPSLLKLSSIFCLLSRSEGFSNAILEAMASGLPCVVTDVGGNREAIDEGRSGFLVPSEDARLAADRILTLARRPELATRMGKAGRQDATRKFTVDTMVNQWASLYDSLIAARYDKTQSYCPT